MTMRSPRKRLFTRANFLDFARRFFFIPGHGFYSFPGKDCRELRQHPLFKRSITVSADPQAVPSYDCSVS